MKLQQLKEKKTKILDEVMEKETYKVAKQILDKFGSNQPSVVRPSVPLGAGLNRQQPTGRAGHVDTSQIRRYGYTLLNLQFYQTLSDLGDNLH